MPDDKAPIPLDEVSRAALGLAAERDLGAALMGFLEQVKAWAAPSAILAAIRDPGGDSGWRLLPVLSSGSGPLGVERTLPQLVQEAPECLERPTLVRPREEVSGVRPRDNCVVPWWHDGESGILVLRGVPRPCPPNLPEAVALLSTPLWSRLVGGPGARVEAGLAQLQRLAERIREDAGRHIDGLKAVASMPAPAPGPDPAQLAALEQQVEAARLEAQGASAARDELKARVAELQKAREEAAVNARATDTALGLARRELTEARQETQRAILELEDFRERHTALEKTLRAAEAERDRLKGELDEGSARPAADAGQLEAARKELADAEQTARQMSEQQQQAEARARAAEERRHEAEQRRQATDEELYKLREELAAARESAGATAKASEGESSDPAAATRLEEVRRALEAQVQAAEERGREADRLRQAAEEQLTRTRQELAEAKQGSQSSTLEVSRLADRLKAVEPALAAAEADRDRGRAEIERLTTRLESLRSDLSAASEQLEAQRRATAEARASRGGEAAAPAKEAPAEKPEAPAEAEPGVLEALQGALSVLRRTPFVPPGLRIAMQEARTLVEKGKEPKSPWLRIVLLDREAASVEPLAVELEEAGIDVRIANYPEEVALLMKTPDARDLNAVISDVLAFRADQNVAGIFRGWQKDRPSLALYLSFANDNPTETERAKRVPLSLTAGRFSRPLVRQELLDMLTPLARRPETT